MNKINKNKIDKILIRAANWVGDAVMSIPMICAVRKNFPKAKIFILAKPWVSPVFENSPYIDQIIIYDAKGRHNGVFGVIRLSKDLRKYKFDLAVLVQNAFEAALIAFLAGIPNRLGYNTDGRTLLLNHKIKMTSEHKKRHQIDYYLGILEGAGLHTFSRKMNLAVSVNERKQAGKNFDKIIGINPGAAYGSAKRWFPQRYARLCILLQKLYNNTPIVVFGGPGEEELGHEICKIVGKQCINLCGKTTLRQVIALIEKCTLFVTNDSGLMHIAAALDIPQIAIFGPTNHTTTSPAGDKSHMVRVTVPCSPCMKPECPLGHHNCMKAVTIDMVYEKVKQLQPGL